MRISISNLAAALVLILGACVGDTPPPVERQCTKSLYEPCFTEHDCMNEICREFEGDGIKICTQGCDANNPCPDLGTERVTCNAMNVCKPATPVECMVVP